MEESPLEKLTRATAGSPKNLLIFGVLLWARVKSGGTSRPNVAGDILCARLPNTNGKSRIRIPSGNNPRQGG